MYKTKTNLKRCQERNTSVDVFLFSEIISCLLLKNKEVTSASYCKTTKMFSSFFNCYFRSKFCIKQNCKLNHSSSLTSKKCIYIYPVWIFFSKGKWKHIHKVMGGLWGKRYDFWFTFWWHCNFLSKQASSGIDLEFS